MKTKNKISSKFFAFLMLFSFANLLAYNIVQLQCSDSCAIHSKMDEDTCHTKTVEKSCCSNEQGQSDTTMDLADCNCDHSFQHTYVNSNYSINFDLSTTLVIFKFPTLEEVYKSIYTPDIQTQFNNSEHIYKSIETFLI